MTLKSDVILERMMTLHPKVMDLTLGRVWTLLDRLGNPQNKLPPVIHIAGTNGKGSTQAMMRAGLEATGAKVHAYTSPHLARFHERVRLTGELISEDHLTEILDRCYEANNGEQITYFEITTVAAILAFAETPADYTLLEVGLGGRLDATNVIDTPALTMITPVDLDHQQFLGETLPEIAGEKAGIIKQGILCAVGPQQDAAMDVIERQAMRHSAPLIAYGQQWHVSVENDRLIFQDENGLLDLPKPALRGPHQIQNAGLAIAGLRALGVGEAGCEAALTNAYWPARMQKMTSGVLVEKAKPAELWLDGGHNPAAGRALADTLKEQPKRPTHLICGMLNTKDISGYLRPLSEVAASLTAVSIPGEQNTISAEETAMFAAEVGLEAHVSENVECAIERIVASEPNARILICGSLYLAGHILRVNDPI